MGKHKGTALANVPADYLIFIYSNYKLDAELKEYIKDNMSVLVMEQAKSKGYIK